jgi:hypothetical protein
LFREETEGEKISRTHPKPCACTNSFWYGTEEERVNSNPSIHKLTLFLLGGFGKGRERGLRSSSLVELLQGREEEKCSDRCCQSGWGMR